MGDREGVIVATLRLGRSGSRADDEAKKNGWKIFNVVGPCARCFSGVAERERSCQRIGASERLNSRNSA